MDDRHLTYITKLPQQNKTKKKKKNCLSVAVNDHRQSRRSSEASSVKTASSRSIDGGNAELLSNRNEGASKQSKAKQGLDFPRLFAHKTSSIQLQWVK
jgi:hypothetical protein